MPTAEAWLNVTYNYANYYYEAARDDDRFYGMRDGKRENLGIRGIYGKTGAESIAMLLDLAQKIKTRYNQNGEWISTQRKERKLYDASGHEVDIIDILHNDIPYTEKECIITVNEGDVSNYWIATAANAIRPLMQLATMASLRPDGIWEGD